ncbi:MAG TPA: universal stress protein [Thermodesulfobacteriota bacterium]
MIKLDKILWATDGSKEGQEALNYAKLLAKAFNSEIIGLHIIKSIDKRFWGLLGERVNIEELSEDTSIKANWFNVFEEFKEELKREGLKFSFKILSGAPHEKIIEFANKKKVDFIVMGKRGLGLKDRMLIGSNTIKILQMSQFPVLAVKRRGEKTLPRIKKILVPFDVSEKFDSALRYAVSLGKTFNGIISVIYVLELISYPYEFRLNVINEIKSLHNTELKNKISEIYSQEGDKVKIRSKVIESINPYLGIIRYAEDERPDLIVMNTHGRKGMKKLMLGSVAEKVIQEAPCSILAIKPVK